MTTLAAGSSVTITLDGDDVLTTDGNATFQITPTTGGKGEGYLTGRQTLGPYKQYVTIVLTAINPIVYSQASDTDAAEIARYAKDASGNITGLVSVDGTIVALSEVTDYVNLTATGTAFTGACEYAGYVCTVAAGNITVYDNTSAAGTVIVPTTALVVGAFPIFGAGTNGKMMLTTGCHVALSGAATVNVLVG